MPLLAVVLVLAEYRRRANLLLAPFVIVTLAGDQLLTILLKGLVGRIRPTPDPAAAHLGPSFPSGHSSTASSFYAAAAMILAREHGMRATVLLGGAAVALAAAVATSRVLLDVHWVSDVVAGVALGWAWCALCVIAFGGRLFSFHTPGDDTTSSV